MATALSLPTLPTSVTGASYIPDMTESANIQTALKYLYYGSTGLATATDGIYGALTSLKSYVDAAISGVNIHENVKYATTTTLAAVYAAGTTDAAGGTGIGAKITFSATGVQAIDAGANLVLNDRVLVKNGVTADAGTSSKANGIYYVTTAPAVGVAGVLTRAEDSNNSVAGEMGEGDMVYVTDGSTQPNTTWILTASSTTGTGPAGTIKIGTDAVTYTQFGSITWGSQTANTFFAGPTTGTATPAFRTFDYRDISTLSTPTVSGQVPYYAPAGNGIAWTSGTLSIPTSASLTLSGGFALTLTQTAATNVTLPTSGTLATIDTAQTFSAIKAFGTTNTTAPFIIQQTPSTVSATSTLTTAQLLTYVINTTSATAITVTLPTGTSMEAVQASAPPNGAAFDFYVVNSGAGVVTIAGNTNNTLTTYGFGATVAATSGSAYFRTYKNATNAWTTLRLR